jgi:hypothetical protein
MGVYARGDKLWTRFRDVGGKWRDGEARAGPGDHRARVRCRLDRKEACQHPFFDGERLDLPMAVWGTNEERRAVKPSYAGLALRTRNVVARRPR